MFFVFLSHRQARVAGTGIDLVAALERLRMLEPGQARGPVFRVSLPVGSRGYGQDDGGHTAAPIYHGAWGAAAGVLCPSLVPARRRRHRSDAARFLLGRWRGDVVRQYVYTSPS
jgi:hypothetical protein